MRNSDMIMSVVLLALAVATSIFWPFDKSFSRSTLFILGTRSPGAQPRPATPTQCKINYTAWIQDALRKRVRTYPSVLRS